MTAAIFLDRDGTLIQDLEEAIDPDKVKLIRGAAAAVASLRGLGYKIVVVTNQGGVAKGMHTEEDIAAVHDRINDTIKQTTGASIDRFYFCPYSPEGAVGKYRRDHPWRKPHPGMILQAANDLELDLEQSWMIGDQIIDVQAGISAGTRTIILDPHVAAIRRAQPADVVDHVNPDFVAPSLVEAVVAIAQQRRPEIYEHARDSSVLVEQTTNAAPAQVREPEPWPGPQPTIQSTPRRPKPTSPTLPRIVDDEPKNIDAGDTGLDEELQTEDVELDQQFDDVEPQVDSEPQSAELPNRHPVAASDPFANNLRNGPAYVHTLNQILYELRAQRPMPKNFSYVRAFAVVLQMVAALCLIFAFFAGRGDTVTFLQWIGCGVFLELATVAMLLFDR